MMWRTTWPNNVWPKHLKMARCFCRLTAQQRRERGVKWDTIDKQNDCQKRKENP
jgi:hypothetical protein